MQEEQLRVALMEYLHKYCNDTDKLMMVTINFKMLREQAKATEDHAKKALAGIKRSHLGEVRCFEHTWFLLYVRQHSYFRLLYFLKL